MIQYISVVLSSEFVVICYSSPRKLRQALHLIARRLNEAGNVMVHLNSQILSARLATNLSMELDKKMLSSLHKVSMQQ